LEKLDTWPLARTKITHYYGGIRLAYLDEIPTLMYGITFTFGPTFASTELASQAQGTQAVKDSGFRFGVNIMLGGAVKTW
jgi:hypothetical protein